MQTERIVNPHATPLKQGSIVDLEKATFKIRGERKTFFEIYTEVTATKWGIILNQDCDLENEGKVEYITIGILDPFSKYPRRFDRKNLDFKKKFVPFDEGKYYYCDKMISKDLGDSFENILGNRNNYYIFLTLRGENEPYHVVDLTKTFPLKIEHKESLHSEAKHIANNGFNYLLGWKLAYLYGRVGVADYRPEERLEVANNLSPLILKNYESSIDLHSCVNIENEETFKKVRDLTNDLERSKKEASQKKEALEKAPPEKKEHAKKAILKLSEKVKSTRLELNKITEAIKSESSS